MTMEKLYEDYPTHKSRKYRWDTISKEYLLTEEFINANISSLNPYKLCKHQNLSDSLKLKFLSKCPLAISMYQRLSEHFISANWEVLKSYAIDIATYQSVSPEFRKEYDLNKHIDHETNWLYWSDDEKANYIKEHTKYELYSDEQGQYILAYKGVEEDGYSKFNWHIQYKVGKTYEPVNNCSCINYAEASSGLSAWYKQDALDYCNEKLLLVKIYLKNLGVIVEKDKRIRCRKLTVIEEVK